MWAVGKLLRVSVLVLVVYGGLLYLTGLELRPDAHRLHSRPGPGLSVRGGPASRLGLAGAHRRGDGPRRRDHPQHRRESPTRSASPACRSCWGPTARTWARCSWSSIRSRSGATPELRADAHRRRRSSAGSTRRSRRPRSCVFGPPPVRGLGTAGGFRIMIEDRGNEGPLALQEQTDNLVQQGNERSDAG